MLVCCKGIIAAGCGSLSINSYHPALKTVGGADHQWEELTPNIQLRRYASTIDTSSKTLTPHLLFHLEDPFLGFHDVFNGSSFNLFQPGFSPAFTRF